jgi:ubiquitin C-terminal hydrolase
VALGSRCDERVTLGLLRLLEALGACSNECNALLSAHLGELISMYLVTEARAQPPTAVRHACLSMLQSACRRLPNLLAVLDPLDAIHAANRRAEWSITPASEMRRQHAGIVNQGATCYMNATLQQLFMVMTSDDR